MLSIHQKMTTEVFFFDFSLEIRREVINDKTRFRHLVEGKKRISYLNIFSIFNFYYIAFSRSGNFSIFFFCF